MALRRSAVEHASGQRWCWRSAACSTAWSSTVDQWVLLFAVFVLTLAALYGLGMMLASLFVLWGARHGT